MSGDRPTERSDEIPEKARKRTRELQAEIFLLEARLSNAKFEDKEAYRRALNERRGELHLLHQDYSVNVGCLNSEEETHAPQRFRFLPPIQRSYIMSVRNVIERNRVGAQGGGDKCRR